MKRKPKPMSAVGAAAIAIAKNPRFNVSYCDPKEQRRAAISLARSALRGAFNRAMYRSR